MLLFLAARKTKVDKRKCLVNKRKKKKQKQK